MTKNSKWDKFNESFDEDVKFVKVKSGPMKYISTDGFEKINFYKPKKSANARDLNRIDIVPFQISRSDYCKFKSEKGKVLVNKEVGDVEYKLEVPIHKRVGIDKTQDVVCLKRLLGKTCVICDENQRLYSEGKIEEAKSYYPSWRVFYNVIDLNEPAKGIQIWATTVFEVEADLQSLANLGQGKQVRYAHPTEGEEIHFFGKKRVFAGKESVLPTNFQFVSRESEYDEGILLEAYPLDKMLVLPTKEEVEQIFYSSGDEEEQEADENFVSSRRARTQISKEVEAPAPVRRKPKAVVEEEQEVEAPAPVRRKEKVIEEQEEEVEVPTSVKRKPKVIVEEEQEEAPAPAPIRRKAKVAVEEEEKVPLDNKKVHQKLEKDAEKTFNKASKISKCPAAGNFGDDFNSLDNCDDCPQNTFDACGDKFDENNQ